jgi:hypothetical protein
MNLDYPSQNLRERRSTQHLGPSCEVSPFACCQRRPLLKSSPPLAPLGPEPEGTNPHGEPVSPPGATTAAFHGISDTRLIVDEI